MCVYVCVSLCGLRVLLYMHVCVCSVLVCLCASVYEWLCMDMCPSVCMHMFLCVCVYVFLRMHLCSLCLYMTYMHIRA